MTRSQAVNQLREFIRDKKEINRLLQNDYENDPSQLQLALDMAVDDFNMTPPSIGSYSLENFPSNYLLIMGATVSLLESAGIVQSRNRLNYADGGLNISVSDKASEYHSWISLFINDYENKKLRYKQTQNLEACWSI